MMIYNKKSDEKVCHYSNCPEVSYIPYEDRGYITPFDAKCQGFEICEECNILAHMMQYERQVLNAYCKKEGLSVRIEFDKIKVKSPLNTWLISIDGRSKRLYLHHKNDVHTPDREDTRIPGYHPHKDRAETILGMLEHIVHHDNYRMDKEYIAPYKAYENSYKYGSSQWKQAVKLEAKHSRGYSIRATLKALDAIKAQEERKERQALNYA